LDVESEKNKRGRILEFLPSSVLTNAKAEVRGTMKVYAPDVLEAAACCLSCELVAFRGPGWKAREAEFQKLLF
jgi:hypothetical protein